MNEENEQKDIFTIAPGEPWWRFRWNEVWDFRYLLKFLLLRDLKLVYKQTILGPVHLFIRPVIMTLVFQLVFSEFGRIPTDGVHPFLFYYANQTLWAFFSGVFSASSGIFSGGKGLMSKVYFPRIIPVFSSVMMNAVTLGIQMVFFFMVYLFLFGNGKGGLPPVSSLIFVIPVIQMGLLAMGIGLVFASLTLRYRDLNSLSGVIIQGMMYLSPVIYPLAVVPEKYQAIAYLNPLASAMESFRFMLFGAGTIEFSFLLTGWIITIIMVAAGLISFNLTQRKFVDIV
jgi:lipopolysaccharide transport system permease protein